MSSFSVVCLSAVIFSVLLAVVWFREKNIIESSVLGVTWFFCSYVFSSMGLFVIDKFSLFRAGALSMMLNVFLFLLVLIIRRKTLKDGIFKCDFSIKSVLIPIIICILAFPLVKVKNEVFGMGQDQGVYQMQAVALINNDNAKQKDFEEYHKLETPEERETFEYWVRNYMRGYDILSSNFPAEGIFDFNVSRVSGIFHGIPTYTSMLAMWGEIFGMENMADIETVFYICMIFLVYFICRNLRLKNASCICACILSASAPVVIWSAKSTLTEMFLALIPLMFMYFMTDDENPDSKWLSIIPVAVFGCYHVSIYTMIPLFFMVYGGMYFFTREKQYAVLMPVTAIGYLISYFCMRNVQPAYTMNNYSPVFVGGIDVNNLNTVVSIFSMALLIVSVVFVFFVSEYDRKNIKKFNKNVFNQKASENKIFKIFLSLLIILPVLFIIIKAFSKYNTLKDANVVTLWGFICNAGIILIPLTIIFAVISPEFYIQKNSRLTVFLMFFYCILVYSAFLRYDIQYYFYYSRYLVPFISVAVIFGVLTLDKFGRKLIYPISLAGIFIVYPYDIFLMNAKDDTRMEWAVMEDICDIISDGDCVVMDKYYTSSLFLPIRNITEADVYPYFEFNENQFAELQVKYDKVFYITNKMQSPDDFVTIYKNTIEHSEDDSGHTGELIPMPYKFLEYKDDIFLYSFEKYKLNYRVSEDYQLFNGFYNLENNFCWSSENETEILAKLYPSDYNVTVSFGTVIPFDSIDIEEFNLEFYINDRKVGTILMNSYNNCEDIRFNIPEYMINDGENIIKIKTDLWNASQANPADSRMLGIPLESIAFSAS